MKKIVFLFVLLIFSISYLMAGTPTIDGSFDGTGVWGEAVATADGTVGWASVNCNKLYVTYDATYAYYAASFNSGGYPADWLRAGFAINVTTGGGSSDPWGVAVSYGYTNKPDFVVLARFGDTSDWAELRSWNGASWDGSGTNIFSGDINWAADNSYIECRVSLATMSNPSSCDVQFYVSGNNETEHGVFDACPDDEDATSWNDPTTLDNYVTDITLPVELSAFTAQYLAGKPLLYWTTQSETDNMGWFVYRNQEEDFTSATKVSGMIEGHGTTTQAQSYVYEDIIAHPQVDDVYYYWLESVDYSGTIHHFDKVAMITIPDINDPNNNITPPQVYDLISSPNPFDETTNIKFMLTQTAFVDVAIYDVKGALVKSFDTQHVTAETPESFEWNGKDEHGKNLSNGIYLYSVKVNGQDYATKQVILMK